MRKFVALSAALILVVLVVPAASAGKGKKQVVEGAIALPAPFTDSSGCYAGLHRRAAIVTQDNNNGIVGYHFDVDKKTWGKPFVLEATGGQGTVDLDIYFYLAEFGTLDQVITDPLAAGAPPSVQMNTREEGGESGEVPKKALRVIVCMYGGPEHTGFGANFTYTAGDGVKLPKK